MSASSAPTARSHPFDVTNRMVFAIAVPMTFAYLTTPLQGLVGTAVVGHMGDAALIGGLAVGAIIFDLIFTTFNFLRSATTGLVAQAVGRGDAVEEQAVFWRSLIIGVVCGIAVILIAPLIRAAGIGFMAPGPAVRAAAETYLAIRILSAPFALANYAILGFVLGRGEGLAGLLLQTIINGATIVLSLWLGLHRGLGIEGVAWATVASEVIGAIAGFAYVVLRFAPGARPSLARIVEPAALFALMRLNRDIMIRSFALLAAFAVFTRAGAGFGATVLAANAILMNIFLVAGYYLDGFATAAEQIVGRSIGANHRPAFDRAIRLTVLWGFALAGLTTIFFLAFGKGVVAVMTTAPDVQAAADIYLPWAAVTAVAGVLAFEMDGVFIGATWSRDMRNMMLASLALFLAAIPVLTPLIGNHGLWLALNLFLVARGVTLFAILGRRADGVFGRAPAA